MNKKSTHHSSSHSPSGIKIIKKNKKAFFDYEILDRYECGIILLGAEVKSIREHAIQFVDSFARIKERTLVVHNMHISPYKFYTGEQIDAVRIRQLLIHNKELKKIKRQVEEKGNTLIPLTIYLKNGLVKMELGICRGKKLHDKKELLKQKTADREAQREIKAYMKE